MSTRPVIRKKAKVDWGVEKFAVDRAIRAIRDCDIAVLVIDAADGLTDQDKKISQIVVEAGKGLIVAINKWDLVEDKDKSDPTQNIHKDLCTKHLFLILHQDFYQRKNKTKVSKHIQTGKRSLCPVHKTCFHKHFKQSAFRSYGNESAFYKKRQKAACLLRNTGSHSSADFYSFCKRRRPCTRQLQKVSRKQNERSLRFLWNTYKNVV